MILLAGCTSGELGSNDETADSETIEDTDVVTGDSTTPGDSSVPTDSTTTDTTPAMDSMAPFDGAPADLGDGGCAFAGASIASTLTTTVVASAAASEAILAERPGGLVTAWRGGSGWQVTPLDKTGARAGSDIAIADALKVYGVAAGADGYAVLISRAPDYMTFVRISGTGSVVAKNDLVGGGDHAKVGTEWFGEFANTGRLVATATGFAAYFGLHRRWPDMIGHQGDTLRTFTSAGAVDSTIWDWGCSHSLDQRIDFNGTRLGPLCLSDCYPQKAIMFNHSESVVSSEPSGNCAGGSTAGLGAIVGDGSGFVAAVLSREGRTSKDAKVVRIGNDGKVGTTTWITSTSEDENDLHLARFGGSFLAAWVTGSNKQMQRIDSALALIGSPETVSVPYPSQDFVSLSTGDAAWATADGSKLTIVRAKACP